MPQPRSDRVDHRRPPTRILRVGASVVGIAALWSLGWFLAAQAAGSRFDGWVDHEAAAGRQWACPARQIVGYPLALRIQCTRPTFRGEIAGHTSAGVVEGLTASVELAHADTLLVGLRGPLNLRAEDGTFDLEVSWSDLGIEIPHIMATPAGGSLAMSRLAVSLSTRDQGDFNMRASHLQGDATAVAQAAADRRFAFAAQSVSFPTLDPIPGLDEPADAAGQGTLSEATLLTAPTVARLEAWRRAGGELRLAALSMRKGLFSGKATGTLALDDAHRPAGRLDTSLAGFGPIAKQFGIPVGGVELGGLLSTLLGGGKPAPAEKGSVRLPLVFSDGRLSVGPFVTGARLAPLY